jgi:hypothetical protein
MPARNFMVRSRVAAVLLVWSLTGAAYGGTPLMAASAPSIGSYTCLQYGLVSLTGVLVRQTYPGPPDYESITKGDEPQIILVLQLDSPVCVDESGSGYPGEYNEREIQLDFGRDRYAQYRNLLGKRIIATGVLIRGGARHDKRLVLAQVEIERAPPRP